MAPEGAIAIVGMGVLFPGSETLEQLWANVRDGLDVTSAVPPGRWLLDPSQVFDSRIGCADRVYATRGGFVVVPPAEDLHLDLDRALWERLDPLYHLALAAAWRAWRSAQTGRVDRTRAGVVFGNIVLPTETASSFSREVLDAAFAEKLGLPPLEQGAVEPCNALPAGLPAALVARALKLGGAAYTLDAACSSSLYALKLACDELHAGRADLMLTGGVSRPDPLYTQMGFSQLRALSRAAGPRRSTTRPMDWSSVKGPECSCSSGSKTHSSMAIGFMASSPVSACRTTSPAICSRPAPKGSFVQCVRLTNEPAGAPPTST